MASVAAMTYRLSRLMSVATAGYGAFALARPGHLPAVLGAAEDDRAGLELLAQTYGVRDLAISSLGVLGRSAPTVRAAMLMRIASDLGDSALLTTRTADDRVRRKVLVATIGWAGLNTLALLVDSRRARG